MIEVADALRIVLDHARPRPGVETALSHLNLGQVLAEDVTADIDSPPFTKALMDGYAVRTADIGGGPVELEVLEEVQAGGARPAKEVGARQATAIYTGAPMPDGADAVAMKERCERLSESRVRVDDPKLMPGKNVQPRGGEMKAGEIVLPRVTPITPATIGLLAAVGRTSAKLFRPPTVAILATGDELVSAEALPLGSQIRNTNGPMLCALVGTIGLPHDFGIAHDKEEDLKKAVSAAVEKCDVLLLAGGVSAGKFDLVPGVLEACGVTAHFHKVRMKPGKPLLFGTLGEKLVFGLPGNPVSAFVCFELFVKPALRVLAGHSQPVVEPWELPLAEALSAQHDRPTFHPARIFGGKVCPLPWRGSAELRGLLNAEAFLELPAGPVNLHRGDLVRVRPFG